LKLRDFGLFATGLFSFDIEEFLCLNELEFKLIGLKVDFEFHFVFGLAVDLLSFFEMMFCFGKG
jgi:hypothetical protein